MIRSNTAAFACFYLVAFGLIEGAAGYHPLYAALFAFASAASWFASASGPILGYDVGDWWAAVLNAIAACFTGSSVLLAQNRGWLGAVFESLSST